MTTVRVKGYNLQKFQSAIRRMKVKHHPFRKYHDTYEIDLNTDPGRLNFLILSNVIDSVDY